MGRMLTTLMMVSILAGSVSMAQDAIAFMDVKRWEDNADGGAAPTVTQAADGLRFEYRLSGPNNWGNARFQGIHIEPYQTSLELEVCVEAAEDAARMHIWFFEPDGDCWMTQLKFADGQGLSAVLGTWRQVKVPFGDLRFQPRGNKEKTFLNVDRMLLGFNFGNITARVRNIRFTGQAYAAQAGERALRNGWEHPSPAGRRIGIFYDPQLHGVAVARRVERIQELLRGNGYDTVTLWAGDLEQTETLNRDKLDLVIFPDAALFPMTAVNAFKAFLKAGGRFLTFSGYPFDKLLVRTPVGWQLPVHGVTAALVGRGVTSGIQLNTRYGGQGDTMKLDKEQIGACDPSFLLRHAVRVRTAAEQAWVTEDVRLEGRVEGPAAVAMTGNNSPVFPDVWGRYIPLLEAEDAFGRPRGPVAAVVLNHRGPYAGSNWGFVTPQDANWLDGGSLAFENVFVMMCRRLLGTSYLVRTNVSRASAAAGETVTLQAWAHIEAGDELSVRYVVDGREAARVALASGDGYVREATGAEWTVPADGAAFHEICVELWRGAEQLDVMYNGLVVRQSSAMQEGVSISLQDNYFRLNGEKTFFTGANTTGMMWYSWNENPRVWQRDFAGMRDYGLNMLRILHFSPFCDRPAKWGAKSTDLLKRPPETIAQTDAIVQLAQQNQVMVFLSLHDWIGLDESDESLAAQADWDTFWVSRYRDVPGIFYDIQNEPTTSMNNTAVLEPLFRQYLTQQYGSVEAAQAAWQASGAGTDVALNVQGKVWTDLRARDVEQFRAEVFRRWAKANMSAIKAGNPQALGTVGYLQSLFSSDKPLGTQELDFANVHHYGALGHMRAVVKLMDRRWCGRSLSLGEFGSSVAHAARNNGDWGEPSEASIRHYLAVGHCLLGMGGSFMGNWSWKDFQDCVFPWGINHADLTAKPVLEAYRNLSLLFRQIRPRYEAPEVYLVVPDGYRFGFGMSDIHEGIRRAADGLLMTNVPFSVISEWTLDGLPKEAKALVWPLCYGAKNETFAFMERFVAEGGSLLLTGDPRFGYDRTVSRPEGLAKLGVQTTAAPRPPQEGRSGEVSVNVVSGRVMWVADAMEQRGDMTRIHGTYKAFLDDVARVWRIRLGQDDGKVLAFELPTDDGAAAVLVNMSGEARRVSVPSLKKVPAFTADVARERTAFVQLGRDGAIRAVNCQGSLRLTATGRDVCTDNADVALVTLDGQDLARSAMVLALPFAGGAKVQFANAGLTDVETGDFRGGVWRRLSGATDEPAAALDMRLLTTAGKLPAARAVLEKLLKLQWERK